MESQQNGTTQAWISRQEAAKQAEVSLSTIDRRIKEGVLDSYVLAHERRIRMESFMVWLTTGDDF